MFSDLLEKFFAMLFAVFLFFYFHPSVAILMLFLQDVGSAQKLDFVKLETRKSKSFSLIMILTSNEKLFL